MTMLDLEFLDKRFGGQAFTYQLFNEFQKIIVQVPVCPYCKPDPCWGPVIKNNQPFWVCKCVKIDCQVLATAVPILMKAIEIVFTPI